MYIVIWQYLVNSESEASFERMYGPHGDWGKLFRQGSGYSKTILIKEAPEKRMYQTLDFWESREAYENFYKERETEISTLDQTGDTLTSSEIMIGRFVSIG